MILVPHNRHAGLFSHINFIITHLDHSWETSYVVDWTEGLLYGEPSAGNIFELLFEQMGEREPMEPTCRHWPHYKYTGGEAAALYTGSGDQAWRLRLHRCWQRLRVRKELLAEVDEFMAKNGPIGTAMHVRNHRIGAECPGGFAPRLDDYMRVLNGVEGRVFLATDNMEAVRYFTGRFGNRIVCRDIPRSPDMETEFHLTRQQTAEDAGNCLVDALIMARCGHLIHSVSNIATAVLYMNPAMAHTYVPGLGLTRDENSLVSLTLLEASPTELVRVEHPMWSDWILLHPNQVMCRHSNPNESGLYEFLGNGVLRLRWANWAAETFRVVDAVQRPNSKRNGLNSINTLIYNLAVEKPIIEDGA